MCVLLRECSRITRRCPRECALSLRCHDDLVALLQTWSVAREAFLRSEFAVEPAPASRVLYAEFFESAGVVSGAYRVFNVPLCRRLKVRWLLGL